MKKALLYIFLSTVFNLGLARSADPEFFGQKLDEFDYSDYIDYIKSGYREMKFESAARKYIVQDLNDTGLVNSGIFLLNAFKEGIGLTIWTGLKDIKIELDENGKKAFLISILRRNIYNTYPAFKTSQNDKGTQGLYIIFKINESYKELFRFNQIQRSSLWQSYYIAGAYRVFIPSVNYDIELAEVLEHVFHETDPIIDRDSFDKISNGEFRKEIAENYHSLRYNQLIEMFDFIQSGWDSEIQIKYFETYKNRLLLSLERSRALKIALARVRLAATNLYPKRVQYPDGHQTADMSGWTYGFVCEMPIIGRYEIYIQDDAKDVVWVKSSEVKEDSDDKLIPNGKYYSPELYNVVLSVFGEIARQDFLESAPEKQEAKAE